MRVWLFPKLKKGHRRSLRQDASDLDDAERIREEGAEDVARYEAAIAEANADGRSPAREGPPGSRRRPQHQGGVRPTPASPSAAVRRRPRSRRPARPPWPVPNRSCSRSGRRRPSASSACRSIVRPRAIVARCAAGTVTVSERASSGTGSVARAANCHWCLGRPPIELGRDGVTVSVSRVALFAAEETTEFHAENTWLTRDVGDHLGQPSRS
jgi:hypothetical protein